MKKKIAVIANGWYNRGLSDIMKGITAYTGQRGIGTVLNTTTGSLISTDFQSMMTMTE